MKTPEELAEEFANQEDTGSDTFAHGLRNGFLAGYKAAQEQLADVDKVIPQWISVKDRLPEEGESVLIFDTGCISVNFISRFSHKWDLYQNGFDCEPTHWQPLPEPPKEEK